MTRPTLARAVALSLVLLAGSGGLACHAVDAAAETADGSRYVLAIEGMSCAESCPPQVKSSLESIEGVKSVEVSYEDKRAIVQMSPGHELTKEICDKSFRNKGYFVSSLTREGAAN